MQSAVERQPTQRPESGSQRGRSPEVHCASFKHCTQRPPVTSQSFRSSSVQLPAVMHGTQMPRAPSHVGAELGQGRPFMHDGTQRRVVVSQVKPSPQSPGTPHWTQR